MLRTAPFALLMLSAAAPGIAQRAEENAVKAASDAFGTSVGNQNVGLYSAGDVRGFSPITAGNIRIDGLAVTEHGGFTTRIVSGSTIRVGLTAQGYPFPAPTGIADYALRNSGNDAVLSSVVYLGPFGTHAVDLDSQIPIVTDRLSLAAGVSYRNEEHFPGETGRILQGGGVLRWRPADGVEVKTFYGRMAFRDDRTIGSIFVDGPYLPPKVEREFFGLGWANSSLDRDMLGTVASAQITPDWTVRAGLFHWNNRTNFSASELYRNVKPDESAQLTLVANADQKARSTSGEVRSSYSLTEANRRHTIHLALRGRDTRRLFGGSDVRDLGAARIGESPDIAKPQFHFGAQTQDEVRQVTGGIGYEGRWLGVGELTLGLQKTDYRKDSHIPGLATITTEDDPWLVNAALALQVTDKLVAYAGYTTGLEESGTAPANAVNRNEAPPALRTSQRDAGLRYAITPKLNLVAGVFDVQKPYFNLDPDKLFRQLGEVRHRGVELSLAGQPIDGLSMVAGAVLLDAQVSGEAVELGIIGGKPVGTASRFAKLNLDYRLPSFEPLSLDLGINHQTGKVASSKAYAELGGEQLRTDAITTVDLGARYRFKLAGKAATLRGQVTNLFDAYAWNVSSNASFRFIDTRRFLLNLAADF